jgi:translation initiation factor 2 beta subunit (eIF-2beta)/eIF-5
MSKHVNIDATKNDPTYRYKMPSMLVKAEGKGKTVILNLKEVAKSLKCDPTYPMQFFSLELGTQTRYDKAKNRAIINGAHAAAELARVLDKFIVMFVLCPVCKLPEMALSIHKRLILMDCAACGHNGNLESHHKFETFVLKNPPAKHLRNVPARANEADGAGALMPPEVKEAIAEEDVEWSSDISADAVAARLREEMALIDPVGATLQLLKEAPSTEAVLSGLTFTEEPSSVLMMAIASRATAEELVARASEYEHVFKTLNRQAEVLVTLNRLFEARGDLGSRALYILHSLYESDVIEEPQILDWSAHTDVQHPVVLKFLDWLESAETEE